MKVLHVILVLGLFFLARPAHGANYLEIALGKDPKAKCSENEIEIPLERAGNLLLIEASVENLQGYFILDTGAPYLVLNKTYFRSYITESENYATGISGNTSLIETASIDSLRMGPIAYSKIEADVVSLGHIENARGVQILGLLGNNLFTSFEIEIDLSRNMLTLHTIDKKGNWLEGAPEIDDMQVKMECNENCMLVQGEIEGHPLTFALDTGAEINALNNDLAEQILNKIQITGRSSVMGTGEQRLEILIGTLSNLQIKNRAFGNMQTIITPLDGLSEVYGERIDGILGFELLNKGVVIINPRKGEMRIRLFDNFNDSQ